MHGGSCFPSGTRGHSPICNVLRTPTLNAIHGPTQLRLCHGVALDRSGIGFRAKHATCSITCDTCMLQHKGLPCPGGALP